MFHKKPRTTLNSAVEDTPTVMAAVDNYEGARYKILAAGYSDTHISRNELHSSASRMATLQAMADQGQLFVKSRERYTIDEIARDVGDLALARERSDRTSQS